LRSSATSAASGVHIIHGAACGAESQSSAVGTQHTQIETNVVTHRPGIAYVVVQSRHGLYFLQAHNGNLDYLVFVGAEACGFGVKYRN
jgi:hypothetical protein